MLYLKTKYFARWGRKEGVTDSALCGAIREFENGLYDADLGNHLFKKRIALPGRGKSSGARTILFYQREKKLIFCFGYRKNQQEDLSSDEERMVNKLSDVYQNSSDESVIKDIQYQEFIEISQEEGSNEKFD